jgi:hypothetical protein
MSNVTTLRQYDEKYIETLWNLYKQRCDDDTDSETLSQMRQIFNDAYIFGWEMGYKTSLKNIKQIVSSTCDESHATNYINGDLHVDIHNDSYFDIANNDEIIEEKKAN